jgi:hypothetical protein
LKDTSVYTAALGNTEALTAQPAAITIAEYVLVHRWRSIPVCSIFFEAWLNRMAQ